MSAPTPETRIRELVGDLRPVRLIPPLRIAVLWVVAPWLATIAVGWGIGRLELRPLTDPLWSTPLPLAILSGLLLVALGSTLAVLASAVPGRSATMHKALGFAGFGLGLACVAALFQLPGASWAFDSAWWQGSATCLIHACLFGLASAIVACSFVGQAAMRRAGRSAALAVAGSVALGAVVVHAACTVGDAYHQLVAHVLAPVLVGLVLALPLGLALTGWAQRRNAG